MDTLHFRWHGWSKDFFELRNFGKYFFGSLILAGIFFGGRGNQNNLKIRNSSHTPWPRSSVNKFLWLGNLAWDFLEVKFWSRDFLGFVWSPREFFGVLVFAPIRSSLSLEIHRPLDSQTKRPRIKFKNLPLLYLTLTPLICILKTRQWFSRIRLNFCSLVWPSVKL